ncbi:MAG: hypothetical protein IIV14_05755 [Bacteroidaceae bacterium]|nr:hypothetical protein [Bacteroidaceae bacterium]
MIIRYITIRNFGSVCFYHANLDTELNVIDARCISELSTALEFILCSKTPQSVPAVWVHDDTDITAGVLMDDILYTACATTDQDRLQLTVTDPTGADITDTYRYALAHCPEQDAVEHFDGQNKTLPMQLYLYRNCGEHDLGADLSDRTAQLADTQTFRSHLARYLKTFRPEPINCRKKYQAALNSQGKFEVVDPGLSGEVYLSETEEKLFLYICFLNITEFWMDIERIRDLHHEKKPLLIRNFLEYLDESADISSLIARTLKTKRQVILMTPPLDKETKKKWIDEDHERKQISRT